MTNARRTILIIMTLIIIFFVDRMYPLSGIRGGLEDLTRPLQEGIYQHTIRSVRYGDAFFRVHQLYEENRRLRIDLAGYHALQLEIERVQAENEVLRNRAGMSTPTVKDVSVAQVLGSESAGTRNVIVLGVGQSTGVAPNMVVIVGNALLGRIREVTPHRSKVVPITDIESKVPVYVRKQSGDTLTGLVEGNFNVGVKVTQVVAEMSLEVGDQIFTSGLGDIFPADIYIGVITAVTSGRNEIFQEADITLPWNIQDLRTVMVVEGL